MIFKIYDGRKEFYQWDLNRQIVIEDPTINEVHFCNKTDDCSLVVEVKEVEGLRLADVPNILLQTDWPIRVYAYSGDCYTKTCNTFKVNARTKPADYVYTETEVKRWEDLEKKVKEALDNKLDKTAEANKMYGTNAKGEQIQVEYTPNVVADSVAQRTWDGQLYIAKNPNESPHCATSRHYVDGLVNPISEKQIAIEERVSDLESLTLTFTEDKAAAYNKSVPANVGKYALIKSIGGATKKVVSKNILNPTELSYNGGAEGVGYKIESDGTIKFTLPPTLINFTFPTLPIGKYGMLLEADTSVVINFFFPNSEWGQVGWNVIEITDESQWQEFILEFDNYDYSGEGNVTDKEVSFRLAIFEDTTEQPYEPFRQCFINAEVSKIESRGANLIPFPYKYGGITMDVGYTKTQNGLTFEVLEDGWISVRGTPTEQTWFYFFSDNLPKGNYYMGGVQPDSGTKGIMVSTYINESGGQNGSGYTNKAIPHNGGLYQMYLLIYKGYTLNTIFKPILTKDVYVADFKPYKAEPIDTFTIPVEAINARAGGYGLGFIGQWDRQFYNRVFFENGEAFFENPCVEEVYNGADSEGWTERAEKCSYHCPLSTTAVDGVSAEYENITSIGSTTGVYLNSTAWLIVTDLRFPTLDEFKAHLSKNPLTVLWAKKTYGATDITDLFTEDNSIQVEDGGSLRFVNDNELAVPSNTTYITRKGG